MWSFIQNQVLGMQWLNMLIGRLLTALGLDTSQRWAGAINFFLFDVIKIFVLLCALIFIIQYIQSYFPPERTKKILGHFHGVGANTLSALLGTLTPFCSCSSIPLFIGFTSAGLPLGVTFSFLISSPLVDLGSLVLLTSIFGAKVACAYVLVGLAVAVAGGTLIEKFRLERYLAELARGGKSVDLALPAPGRKDRLLYARDEMFAVFKRVYPYVLVGVGSGACIHNLLPEAWITAALGEKNPFSVLIATVVGLPMYADIFGAIPIAEALYVKGAGLGTVLSFMMAVTALSLPSMVMLSRVVRPRLLTVFIVIVAVGIVVNGYLFNALQPLFS